MPKHNERKLSVIYDKRQKDFVVKYPRRCDGALVLSQLVNNQLLWKFPLESNGLGYPYNWEEVNFVEELEKRGYDTTTLKFSIELKK